MKQNFYQNGRYLAEIALKNHKVSELKDSIFKSKEEAQEIIKKSKKGSAPMAYWHGYLDRLNEEK